MEIIKVDAIASTNTFLKGLIRENQSKEMLCVVADEQYSGKGQMGTSWQSNKGENLTCSVFVPIHNVELLDQFYISQIVSLAVYDTLKKIELPRLSIKWPNDILSDKMKICGILIENISKGSHIEGSVIGVGININQVLFDNLPKATSIKQILGCNYNVQEVLNLLLEQIEKRFKELKASNFDKISEEYQQLLFRKDKPSTFLNQKGESFTGIIKSISRLGKLQVLLEDEVMKEYGLKEIKLRY